MFPHASYVLNTSILAGKVIWKGCGTFRRLSLARGGRWPEIDFDVFFIAKFYFPYQLPVSYFDKMWEILATPPAKLALPTLMITSQIETQDKLILP